MAKTVGLTAILVAGFLAACGSQDLATPARSLTPEPGPGAATAKPVSGLAPAPRNAPSTMTSAPACVGLPSCPPPPPDAEGNPGCFYSDGWQSSGSGIEVWYFHDPASMSKPDKVTAVVRKKDGTTESQDANIDAGQQVHRFEFATINQSAVAEVLFDSSGGRCFVAGPGS